MKLTIADIAIVSLIVLKFMGVVDFTWALISPLIIFVVIGFIQGAIESFKERKNRK